MTVRTDTTPAFILAGGRGERLAPLTEALPKPAVSFGGTHRIIDFTLSNCVNSGVRKIFVLTQYQQAPLHSYLRQNCLPSYEMRCLPPVSGKRYRGTADAVFQNLSLIQVNTADHVLVASGDHIYTMDYRRFLMHHAASGADVTIAAVRRPVREATAFGVLDVNGRDVVTRFWEKPSPETLPLTGEVLVSMGVYAFRRSALLYLADRANPTETDFGKHIVPRLVASGRASAYDYDANGRRYWRDVGSLDSYYQANMDLAGRTPQFDPEGNAAWPTRSVNAASAVRVGDSRISTRACIGMMTTIRGSVIGCGARIETGAVVENSVVLPGARLGRNAHVRNAIVAEGVTIGENMRVGENVNLDRERFLITPGGVVVVNAAPRTVRYEGVSERGRRTISAAA